MPITKTITLYTFGELPTAKAKEAARAWYRAIDLDWPESVYDDAKDAGLKITEFDIDRASTCTIKFTAGALHCMNTILNDHGKETVTYKAAQAYEAALDALPEQVTNLEEESDLCEAADVAESDFVKALEKAYLWSLRNEYEYHNSDEYIDETLIANEYTFRENGDREDA